MTFRVFVPRNLQVLLAENNINILSVANAVYVRSIRVLHVLLVRLEKV